MKVAIMQPYLFPYIGYFQMINCVDTFVILDDVQYIKRGWINRNNILSSNLSKKFMFTVPIKKGERSTLIKDVKISNEYNKWKSKFYKTLFRTYGKCDKYEESLSLIREVLEYPSDKISKIASLSLKKIAQKMNIETDFILSSEISVQGKKSEKLINICKFLDSREYINSIGGKEIYTKEQFSKEGIELRFLKTNNPHEYYSILDLMMRDIDVDLQDYVLE